ncbi:hypothetical protein BT63DRAFT_322272 [Microthyrium microscopicum]|uniref:Uncharacterized protein n=1 Tax=Microthyrium microscopicum TaxID=703497 RepID=A0A6A6U4Q2_9PEZI|nr:hypothetical protein BT63DRAFT_322272 [Microthyrium microscopicum]
MSHTCESTLQSLIRSIDHNDVDATNSNLSGSNFPNVTIVTTLSNLSNVPYAPYVPTSKSPTDSHTFEFAKRCSKESIPTFKAPKHSIHPINVMGSFFSRPAARKHHRPSISEPTPLAKDIDGDTSSPASQHSDQSQSHHSVSPLCLIHHAIQPEYSGERGHPLRSHPVNRVEILEQLKALRQSKTTASSQSQNLPEGSRQAQSSLGREASNASKAANGPAEQRQQSKERKPPIYALHLPCDEVNTRPIDPTELALMTGAAYHAQRHR